LCLIIPLEAEEEDTCHMKRSLCLINDYIDARETFLSLKTELEVRDLEGSDWRHLPTMAYNLRNLSLTYNDL
jgi:hypothetical protein